MKTPTNLQHAENRPIAYECHNYSTGHCYVDYLPKEGMSYQDGYTIIPLYNGNIFIQFKLDNP